MNWAPIEAAITAATGERFRLQQQTTVGGGCINSAMKLRGAQREYFIKFNQRSLLDMFEAEADGLRELAAARAVRVPAAICTGSADSQAYIVMEYHTIGSTPQRNTRSDDWLGFWREQRLGEQLKLAQRHGLSARAIDKGERLQQRLGDFFSGYTPAASVLHGDLWSGNYAISRHGEPVIFDPAVYFGDRETDLAMSELFGGFGREFYAAYNAGWALDAGYPQRKTLYNLYHILNHYNLFGGGYADQAEAMIDRLLAELA